MKNYSTCIVFLFFLFSVNLKASEGMWVPLLIEELNYDSLKAKGFNLSPSDIYSINEASLSNAVVIFGAGCTGAIISGEGLLITNHHCGFDEIQKHSTVGRNYLVNGFWAKNKSEELLNQDLTVKVLVEMKDFTDQVMDGLTENRDETVFKTELAARIGELQRTIGDSLNLKASIEKFFEGNKYYLFLYNEYSDVRLVGAPPLNIGNFGRDTDNWVWPRHTGDFSLFRVYTSPDGKPASYSEVNIPLVPQKYLKISAKGIEENEPTIVLGYPGKTYEYLYSKELEIIKEKVYPQNISLREGRLNIINSARVADEHLFIKYASKQKDISNPWKKWQGVLYGFNRFEVIGKKKEAEKKMLDLAGKDAPNIKELFDLYEDTYLGFEPYLLADNFYEESIFKIEPLLFYYKGLVANYRDFQDNVISKEEYVEKVEKYAANYFMNYDLELDRALTGFLLLEMKNKLEEGYHFPTLETFRNNSALEKYLNTIYSKSIFTDSVRFFKSWNKLVDKLEPGSLSDPIAKLFNEAVNFYSENILEGYLYYKKQIKSLNKEYLDILIDMDSMGIIYPDANFTLRMSYGKVEGYSPGDAIAYSHQTYLKGIMEKGETGVYDYVVDDRLRELYEAKDYGGYANPDGRMPVCFVASNHTSGGNSGSPILDANGYLIGVNFDRTWEGTMSDFYYDVDICRNIGVDIRYVLFIIDKVASSGYLINEMDIVW